MYLPQTNFHAARGYVYMVGKRRGVTGLKCLRTADGRFIVHKEK